MKTLVEHEEFTTSDGMHVRLHDPGSDTVVVMVPGATYNSAYWDLPYQPELYSFRAELNASGFATAAVDRLGTGRSKKPVSTDVTAVRQAAALNEVVQTLRGKGFAKVVLAGHSLGTFISIIAAGTYHNVDGLVATGALHVIDEEAASTTLALRGEPSSSLDPGYLTTKAGERYHAFHAPGVVDPQVVATDEATKDVVSSIELADGLSLDTVSSYSALIDVPVLIAVGDKDTFFCTPQSRECSSGDRVVEQERASYASSPDVRGFVLPGAGHNINLDPRAKELQRVVADWLHQLG